MVCKGASAEPTTRRRVMITLCLLFLLALSAFLALLCGQYSVSFRETVSALCPWLLPGVEVTDTAQRVVWNMRMPRIILAILTGAGLGMSGAAFPGAFLQSAGYARYAGRGCGRVLWRRTRNSVGTGWGGNPANGLWAGTGGGSCPSTSLEGREKTVPW